MKIIRLGLWFWNRGDDENTVETDEINNSKKTQKTNLPEEEKKKKTKAGMALTRPLRAWEDKTT